MSNHTSPKANIAVFHARGVNGNNVPRTSKDSTSIAAMPILALTPTPLPGVGDQFAAACVQDSAALTAELDTMDCGSTIVMNDVVRPWKCETFVVQPSGSGYERSASMKVHPSTSDTSHPGASPAVDSPTK